VSTVTPHRLLAVTAPALAVALSVAVSGCSSSSNPAPSPPPRPAPARFSDAQLIQAWADELRAGHPVVAARRFGVPAIAQNGTKPILLRSRGDVVAFNDSLPCGARLLGTRRSGRYVIGTFRLTERPGGQCDGGTGAKAATAFRITGRRIVEWRRVPVPSGPNPAPAPDRQSSRSI
jgi:hypothetical protein